MPQATFALVNSAHVAVFEEASEATRWITCSDTRPFMDVRVIIVSRVSQLIGPSTLKAQQGLVTRRIH